MLWFASLGRVSALPGGLLSQGPVHRDQEVVSHESLPAIHPGRPESVHRYRLRASHLGDQEPGRIDGLPPGGHRGARGVVGRGDRHPGAEVLPEVRGAAARAGREARSTTRRDAPCWAASGTPGRCSIGSPGCWTHWGQQLRLLRQRRPTPSAFYDELCHMLAAQIAAPNSPQWFNTGLHWAYGITGPAQGHYYVEPDTGVLTRATSAYERPAAVTPASSSRSTTISSTTAASWTSGRARRASSSTARARAPTSRRLRGENEPLSGGGKSSGLMSFLKIGDRAAGAIKSGGTTRRAAKMVCLDLDHPDVRSSSAGRWSRSRRWPRWWRARGWASAACRR